MELPIDCMLARNHPVDKNLDQMRELLNAILKLENARNHSLRETVHLPFETTTSQQS